MKLHATLLLVFCFVSTIKAQDSITKKVTHEFEVELGAEYRYFFDKAQFPNQKDHFPSISIMPEYSASWNNDNESINATAFFRWDVDQERTHWDIRELYYQKAKNNWELSLGVKKIFWGVTESNHLIDIINQTDGVESFDGEQKLGQPMAQLTLLTNKIGTFNFFYLPYHRKSNLAGKKGRFRFPTILDKDDIGYESAAEEWRQDLAIRWNHYFGIVDVGLSHFYGNGREPIFNFDATGSINAFFPVINQTGLDLQITHDAFLWKLETIYRSSKAQDFFAMVAGLEYTFSNIDHNGLDIGLLAEYLYDERDELTLSTLQNDIFFGSRIAFNDSKDTAILVGGIVDLKNSSKIISIEASRRLGNSWKLEAEARFFKNIDQQDFILSNYTQDSFFRISLLKYL